MSTSVSRRSVLAGIGATAATVSLTGLAACTPDTPGAGEAPNNGAPAAQIPTYQRFDGLTPDLVGTPEGVPDAFLDYPATPPAATTEVPGSGGELSFLVAADGGVAGAAERNSFWQGLNERLGTDLKLQSVPGAEYSARLNTTMAGGDIPDLVQLNLRVPKLPDLLRHRFTDLTDQLGGDAVKDYPLLANLPSPAWRNVMIEGGIWGVPYPSVMVNSLFFARSDLADSLGIPLTAGSPEEFTELCASLTSERDNRWALGSGMTTLGWYLEMFGAPNEWKVESDGRFIRSWETAEYRAAVEYMADLVSRGVYHPDTFAGAKTGDDFRAGRIIMQSAGVMWWPNFYRDGAATPGFAVEPFLAPKADGTGTAPKFLLNGLYTFAAIRAGLEPDRVREILRIQNHMAAPFGTAEHLYNTYGEEGVHHTRVDGAPTLTDKGLADVSPLPVRFMSGFPTTIFTSGRSEVTQANYDLQKQILANSPVSLPTLGLLSETQTAEGAAIDRNLSDTVSEVVQGRKTMDEFDAAVAEWRSTGGGQIAEEYQAAAEAN